MTVVEEPQEHDSAPVADLTDTEHSGFMWGNPTGRQRSPAGRAHIGEPRHYPRGVRLFRVLGVAVGAAVLILIASAPVANAGTVVSRGVAQSSLGEARPAPGRGPCLQNAAQCQGAGALFASGVPTDATLLVVLTSVLSLALLPFLARRARGAARLLPDGDPIHVMRPPRLLSVFA